MPINARIKPQRRLSKCTIDYISYFKVKLIMEASFFIEMIYVNYDCVRNVKLVQYLQLTSQQYCVDYNYLLIRLLLSSDYNYLSDYNYHLKCFSWKYWLLYSTFIQRIRLKSVKWFLSHILFIIFTIVWIHLITAYYAVPDFLTFFYIYIKNVMRQVQSHITS